jgi:hypothetical protein
VIIEAIGYLGMGLVLATLYLSRKHFFESQVCSLIGGLCLTTNATLLGPLGNPFQMLNGIWTVISIYNIYKTLRERNVKAGKEMP